jgi:hypothetical protein
MVLEWAMRVRRDERAGCLWTVSEFHVMRVSPAAPPGRDVASTDGVRDATHMVRQRTACVPDAMHPKPAVEAAGT